MIDKIRATGVIAYYEWKRMLRVKQTFWLLLFLPILLILILGNALSSAFTIEDQPIERVTVGLYSEDVSNQAYVEMLQKGEFAAYLNIQPTQSLEQLSQQISEGEIAYGINIPADFATNVEAGKAAQWELFPGGDSTANMTVSSVIEPMLEQLNYMQSLAVILQDPQAVMLAASSSSEPQPQYVKVVRPDRTDKEFSAIQYYSAMMLVMFILYTGMSTALSLAEEKELHTLERLYSAPLQPLSILVGKMVGGGLIAILQAAVIIGFTKWIYGVEWGERPISLLLVCLFQVIASISLAVIITAFTSNSKTVQGIFTILIVAMTFLSGGFTPDVGDFLSNLGRLTLNHWASQSMIHLMMDSTNQVIAQHIGVLGCIAAGLFLISALLGRKAVSHE
jgi:ABC-2 type transport system permease protein